MQNLPLMPGLKKISLKDLQSSMSISSTTASRYLSDIKKEFDIKIVTESHVKTYFKLP